MGDMRSLSRCRGKVTSPVRTWIRPLSTIFIKRKAWEVGAARQHGEGSVRTSLMQSRCHPMVPRVLQRQQSLPWQHWNLPSTSAKPEDASNMWWAHMLLLHPPPLGKSLPLMLLNPWLHLCSEGEWSARISWREAVQGKANRLWVSPPFREGLVVGTALAVTLGAACSHHGKSGSREPIGSGTWNKPPVPAPLSEGSARSKLEPLSED